MRKVVIIGGGIAGLAAAKSFIDIGWRAVVCERAERFLEVGLGFIIMPNGLAALNEVGAGAYVQKHGRPLQKVRLRKKNGDTLKEESLENVLAVKRSTCIDALRLLLPNDSIKTGRDFSHYENDESGKIIAAVFKNGDKEYGDVFIAADGANSRSRALFFPDHTIRVTQIEELVGIADAPDLVEELGDGLLKTISAGEQLSIGLLPCNSTQVIWYIQHNTALHSLKDSGKEAKRAFANKLVNGWPQPVQQALDATNFDLAFLWKTKDMDLLPAFHHKNAVLIGDAAHLALPFTSQGTNSALNDALVLSRLFNSYPSLSDEEVFTLFYNERKESLKSYIQFGRELEEIFTHPETMKQSPIPLAK